MPDVSTDRVCGEVASPPRATPGSGTSRAAQIAGRFTARPVVYAEHRFRRGGGYGLWMERVLVPRSGAPYMGKVVVLQSGWCMNSNEGFLAMARALPTVTTVGPGAAARAAIRGRSG